RMNAGAVLGSLLTVLWALDGFRLRGRASALAKLEPSDEPASGDHHFVLRHGVVLHDDTRRAASSFARKNGLRALDLISPSLPSWRALLFLQSIDVAKFRMNRLAAGRSGGDAILVDTRLWDLLSADERAPRTLVDMTRVARKAKLHACTETDVAIAPGLKSAPSEPGARPALVEYVFGEFSFGLLLMQLGLLAIAIALSPPAGLAALAAMNLQLAIGVLGSPLLPRDLIVHTLFRALIDLAMALAAWPAALFRTNPRAEERRAIYDELLAVGTSRFFEPRRETCPICDGRELSPRLITVDRYGFKPGIFTLERCASCGHVFQNPRLSIEGLDFYYRDFYDGLGEGLLDTLFSFDSHSYEMRAKIVDGVATPERWLDVGAGHGHFCCIAREHWKNTEFDGLDLSESI
ncbi:MAG: class I SAM-dependent methyltransferase, partial [Polyangiaceae bacterium]